MQPIRKKLKIFVCVGIVIFLQNCSRENNSNTQIITLNVPANANLLQALHKQLPNYEAEHGVRVQLIPFTGQEKLYAMMAAGQAPDIFYTNTVVRDQLAAEGRLLDLNTIAAGDSFVQQIRPEFIKRGTSIDGGWYQFCDWTYTYAVYFNKTLFDQAQLSGSDSTWTWAGMLDRTGRLTRDVNGDGSTDQYGIFIPKHFVSALERMNGAEFTPNALLFGLSQESQEALQAYLNLIYQDKVMPEIAFTQAQGMQVSQMLNTGKVTMTVEAVPNLDFITALRIDWDMAPLPRMSGKPPRYFRSASGGLSLSASCAHPQDAWKLMKWLVTKSPYNTPNPVLREVDFVSGWKARYPKLRETHFRQVWKLSERFDGGDARDFVRYSSWSSNAILEQLNPTQFAGCKTWARSCRLFFAPTQTRTLWLSSVFSSQWLSLRASLLLHAPASFARWQWLRSAKSICKPHSSCTMPTPGFCLAAKVLFRKWAKMAHRIFDLCRRPDLVVAVYELHAMVAALRAAMGGIKQLSGDHS